MLENSWCCSSGHSTAACSRLKLDDIRVRGLPSHAGAGQAAAAAAAATAELCGCTAGDVGGTAAAGPSASISFLTDLALPMFSPMLLSSSTDILTRTLLVMPSFLHVQSEREKQAKTAHAL